MEMLERHTGLTRIMQIFGKYLKQAEIEKIFKKSLNQQSFREMTELVQFDYNECTRALRCEQRFNFEK